MQLNVPHEVVAMKVEDASGRLYLPPGPRAPVPWVWYAPAQGLGPANVWIATRLLQQGIAFATLNVGESAGSPAATALFQKFYEELTGRHRLSATPVLWPQSRGGLQLYNWAWRHPKNVAAIAGTYTVVNLAEWTTTQHPRIRTLYQEALAAYGVTHEAFVAQLAENNPLEHLAPLAGQKVPILHLHGDSDEVVPLPPHAGELVERYRALGGPAALITVPGKGHAEVPEFFQSQAFLEFMLNAAR
jgi:pimeloyl-ACP methyl ester carboxylesterase